MEEEQQKPAGATGGRSPREQDVIDRLVFASLEEQRRSRRWGIFFKALLFIYLAAVLYLLFRGPGVGGKAHLGTHTAEVDVSGEISESSRANADDIIQGLRDAFEDPNTKGVILRINSPGGSPVQSDYVYREIRRLRKKYPEIPLYAVIVDIGASGAYYMASAADRIYANPASMVGSIGVLMNGFGFVGTMDKLGIDRRLYTAGKNKGFLDPFSPVKPENVAQVHQMLETIHQQFINSVKQGRGDRLKETPEMFSGLVWTGEEAEKLGLIDGMGSVDSVARDVIGAKEIVNYTRKPTLLERFAERVGTSAAQALAARVGMGGEVNLR